MVVGFVLASYSIVGNDAIQTLGTLLSSNAHRPWWLLWLFAGTVMVSGVDLRLARPRRRLLWAPADDTVSRPLYLDLLRAAARAAPAHAWRHPGQHHVPDADAVRPEGAVEHAGQVAARLCHGVRDRHPGLPIRHPAPGVPIQPYAGTGERLVDRRPVVLDRVPLESVADPGPGQHLRVPAAATVPGLVSHGGRGDAAAARRHLRDARRRHPEESY